MKRSIILLLSLLLSQGAYAQMKCQAGKCTSGKAVTAKKIPAIPKTNLTKNSTKKSLEPSLTDKKARGSQTRPTVKQLFNVLTTKVFRKVAAPKQLNYGYVVTPDENRVDVVAWYGGFVVKLYADKRFMKVTKGQPLAKVYSPEVYKAKQDYLNALNFNAKHPSPAMVKGSRIKLELLNVSPKEIKQIERTRRVDAYTTLYAPSEGWIFEKRLNEGSSFTTGMKLFTLVDLSTVWVEAKLYTRQLPQLDNLIDFRIKTDGVQGSFPAHKALLYPKLDPKEATATLRLIVTNRDDLLKPGMYTTIYASSQAREHLLVPRTAVIRKNGEWYAFLATEFKGEYLPVKVKVKALDNRYYEVLEGLREGDEVVNNALFMMDSDAQINGIY